MLRFMKYEHLYQKSTASVPLAYYCTEDKLFILLHTAGKTANLRYYMCSEYYIV